MNDDIIEKKIAQFVDDAMTRQGHILDDFCKAYLAGCREWLLQNPQRIKRLQLRQRQTSDGLGWIYSFHFKRGRAKKKGSSSS